MMFLWSGTCLTLRKNYWRSIGVGALIACILQMFSFVFFSTRLCHTTTKTFLDFEAGREIELSETSASSCSLFFASKCAIASICLWLAAGLLILLGEYPRPVPKLIAHDDDETAAMIRQKYPRIRTRMTSRSSNSQQNSNSQQSRPLA